MKTKHILFILLLSLIIIPVFSQEKSRKEIKNELRKEQQKQTEALVNTKEFVFVGQTAFAPDGTTINITTRKSYVKYHPDKITSYMPYFGKSSGNAGIEGDAGLKFEGKPESYTVKKLKKGFLVSSVIKYEGDTYQLKLNVMFNATATLTASSIKKSSVLYNGNIWATYDTTE